MLGLRLALVAVWSTTAALATPGCISRSFEDGTVCVCNATYCDNIEQLGSIPIGSAVVYRTDAKGARMERSVVRHLSNSTGLIVTLDASAVYQEVIGFGGAFTDSTGVNILSLPVMAQELLLMQYYGPSGTEYTLGRVPMASTDFSPRIYSYDDVDGDFALANFSLQPEDLNYKIPFIRRAAELQADSGGLQLYATPWSSPGWMKTSGQMKGGGELKGTPDGPYYVTWANYFVKFFEAYLAQGVRFWGLTVQNEPDTGADADYAWQTLYFDAQGESKFVKNHLGPTLKSAAASKDLIIMGLDDQRFMLPGWADVMFEDPVVSDYVSGIAVHWYEDEIFPVSALATTHERHPTKFLLNSEACNGWLKPQGKGVRLGYFFRAERYAYSVISDFNNWVAGWTDWNLVLDMQGGYTWVGNNVDSPIIVDGEEFYKQPMYYALAHFSKFLKPGAHRVRVDLPKEGLPSEVSILGAVMVDGQRYITVLNKNDKETATISIAEKGIEGVYTNVVVPAHSIVTVIWNQY